MKVFFYSALCLIGIVLIVAAIAVGPTHDKWGEEGVRSLKAAAVICLSAALLGVLLISIVAAYRPARVGQAVASGTTLHMILTGVIGYAYHVVAKPHLSSFLVWAGVFYLILLIVETGVGAFAVRRFGNAPPAAQEGPAEA